MTGEHLDGTPTTVEERHAELAELHAQVFGTAESSRGTAAVTEPSPNSLSDEEIISRASNAKNGDKFGRLGENSLPAWWKDSCLLYKTLQTFYAGFS